MEVEQLVHIRRQLNCVPVRVLPARAQACRANRREMAGDDFVGDAEVGQVRIGMVEKIAQRFSRPWRRIECALSEILHLRARDARAVLVHVSVAEGTEPAPEAQAHGATARALDRHDRRGLRRHLWKEPRPRIFGVGGNDAGRSVHPYRVVTGRDVELLREGCQDEAICDGPAIPGDDFESQHGIALRFLRPRRDRDVPDFADVHRLEHHSRHGVHGIDSDGSGWTGSKSRELVEAGRDVRCISGSAPQRTRMPRGLRGIDARLRTLGLRIGTVRPWLGPCDPLRIGILDGPCDDRESAYEQAHDDEKEAQGPDHPRGTAAPRPNRLCYRILASPSLRDQVGPGVRRELRAARPERYRGCLDDPSTTGG